MELLKFKSTNGFKSRCGVEAGLDEEGFPVVIFTELKTNPGMSVTNAMDTLIAMVLSMPPLKGRRPSHVKWYEVYEVAPAHYDKIKILNDLPLEFTWEPAAKKPVLVKTWKLLEEEDKND